MYRMASTITRRQCFSGRPPRPAVLPGAGNSGSRIAHSASVTDDEYTAQPCPPAAWGGHDGHGEIGDDGIVGSWSGRGLGNHRPNQEPTSSVPREAHARPSRVLKRSLTPGSPSRLHLQDLHRFHGLRPSPPGSALPCPTRLRAGLLTTRQASLDVTDRSVAHPAQRGARRWASTPPVSRRHRQPATGPPDSYPDRTYTGKRRRAYESVVNHSFDQPPISTGRTGERP